MGKASKWFRGLLGLKKPDSLSATTTSAPKQPKEKRRWSFVKSYREQDCHHATTSKSTEHHARDTYGEVTVQSTGHVAPEKHSIAVAAATAAVAEAAVAAANAAAAVVRLTSSGRCGGSTAEMAAYVAGGSGIGEELAAVKIQAAFRGCLARRALRALKGLVKLQALVRGHIERKRTAVWLQRMQALLRAQARVRAGRGQFLQTSYSSAKSSTLGPATPEKFESPIRSKSMKYEQWVLKRNGSNSCGNRSDRQVDEQSWTQRKSSIRTSSTDDEKSVRIFEIDSGKHVTSKRRSLFNSTSYHALASDHCSESVTSRKEPTSLQSYGHNEVIEESPFCTADNSPQFLSAASKDDGFKRSPFTTPTKSDGSRSYLSGCSDYYPSYMAYTESAKAKVRSLSAPKQRPPYERSNSTSNGYTQRACALHASFASKAYPGSGRLDKFGMPLGYRH